jgi:hypothetical protein
MHFATLLTLPLLAAAVPTSPLVQQDGAQIVFGSTKPIPAPAVAADFTLDLDLNELRLVQFAEDEPPR